MRKTNQTDHATQGNTNDTDFARRRKIMLGMASAPVVLTLSNAAQANASSHQCVTNTMAGTEPACAVIDPNTDPNGDGAQLSLNSTGWAAGPVNTDGDTTTGINATGLDGNPVDGADAMCVPSGEEAASNPGTLNITGYRYNGGYINQDGGPGVAGNPLTASCLASFA